MRIVHLVTGLAIAFASVARSQLAISQATTKLLILPLGVRAPGDSMASIQAMDVARERLALLARYKVVVVPKTKLCEALQASDFPCDVLFDEAQARLLARFLNVQAYTSGTLERSGSTLIAHVRVVDMGSSGYPFAFAAANGTGAAVGEAVAQRLNTIVRAGEHARECNDRRQKGQLGSAIDAAQKALSIEGDLPAAYVCLATVYEAQGMPPDSLIAAATRATHGDSANATAWEIIARAYQIKGDKVRALDAFVHELQGDPQNTQLRLGVAELLRQQKQYDRAVTLVNQGLAASEGEQLLDLKFRICIEGQLWRCALDGFVAQAARDSAKFADSMFLKAAIGAAQQVADTQQLFSFGRAAVRRFPKGREFWKVLGAAYEMNGQRDSAVWAKRQALALDPNDVNAALLVAKAIVDGSVYDTAAANLVKSDTAQLGALRAAFAERLDTARAYLDRTATAGDTSVRISAAVIMRAGGEKLVRAGAFAPASRWLERTMQLVARASPADTVGVRQVIRVNASFWFGLAAIQGLPAEYQAMTKSKSCAQGKAFNERLAGVRAALLLGRSIHPATVDNTLLNLAKFETVMPQVKKQFGCTSF